MSWEGEMAKIREAELPVSGPSWDWRNENRKPREKVVARPVLEGPAFHGLAGEVVRALEPHTEADPAGLLVSFLAGFGCAIGGGPHVRVGGDRHDSRFFPVLVGETARSRKGSAWSAVRPVLERADREFAARQLSGFGSGEAVVDAVRDSNPDRDDPGADDKRLLVHEPEFSRFLRVASREGSTLSPIVRDAWDGVRLQARSRTKTSVASGALVVMICHVVHEELHRYLLDSEVAGGLANRFAFALVGRSKRLPSGGNLDNQLIDRLASKTRDALADARTLGRFRRSPVADRLWETMYDHLTEDVFGVYGRIVARAEAQCLRFSILYAALDGSRTIEVEHLGAAWELWRYFDTSAWRIFGANDVTGDPVADRLLEELRAVFPAELNGTQQRDLFDRHVSGDRLEAARARLEDLRLAETRTEETGGRPRTLTSACDRSDLGDKSPTISRLPSLSSLQSQRVEVVEWDWDDACEDFLNEEPVGSLDAIDRPSANGGPISDHEISAVEARVQANVVDDGAWCSDEQLLTEMLGATPVETRPVESQPPSNEAVAEIGRALADEASRLPLADDPKRFTR